MSELLVGIVGVGNMGAGIAQKLAMEGFSVLVADANLGRAQAGRERVAASLEQAVGKKVLPEAAARAALERVTAVPDLHGLSTCDLVIEVIFEDLLAKKELFRQLDAVCKTGCVLASNTSSFTIHELASVTRRPGEVVGLHYFFHPAKNRLLEVIPGPLTRPEVTAAMVRFAEAHGKTALVCKDVPGFAVNRFFVPWLNEATRLLDEGVANVPSIDAAARAAFGVGMGPFLLMNVTGVPISLHAASTLGTELGPFYEPTERLRAQVEDRRCDWDLSGEPDESVAELVAGRLWAVAFAVAGALVDEGVCSKEDVDRGARIGLAWERGPFEAMNALGPSHALALVEGLCERHPDLEPADCLVGQARLGQPFAFSQVDLRIDAGIARITLNRPERLNALDPEMVTQLSARLDQALANPGLRGIVLAATGKAFVAGADVAFFVRALEAGDLDRIVAFTEAGQALLSRIAAAPVPVVARVHGLAMGGGVELALACHAIVCGPKASFALPETGIGIYPGLGGTQRLARAVGRPLARRMILAGRALSASEAVRAGLALRAVAVDGLDACAAALIAAGCPPVERVPDAQIEEGYADGGVETLLAGRAPRGLSEGATALLHGDLPALGRKAPHALRVAARLIDASGTTSLAGGLALELDALREVFGTADALAGLRSVLLRERPVWQGN